MNFGIIGYVASSGKSVNITDAYMDDRFNPEIDRILKYRTKTLLCVPIFDKNTKSVIGAI
jgi:adenylate cyclase